MVTEWAGTWWILTPRWFLDLEITFGTYGGATALQHVDFGIVEEADWTFLIGIAFAGFGPLETGAKFAVGYDAANMALFPFTAIIQPCRFAACVQLSLAQS